MNKDDYTYERYWFGEWLNGWASVVASRRERNQQLRLFIQRMGGMAGVW